MPIPVADADESLVDGAQLSVFPGAPFDQELVDSAAGTVRLTARWHIAPNIAQTLTIDGNGAQTLFLPTMHLTEVVSVTQNGATVAASDYDWSASGSLTKRSGCWTDRPRAIVVVIRHGYDECPIGLLPAVAEQCRRARIATEYQSLGDATLADGHLSGAHAHAVARYTIEGTP